MSEIPRDILDVAAGIAEQPFMTRHERDRMTVQIARAILADRVSELERHNEIVRKAWGANVNINALDRAVEGLWQPIDTAPKASDWLKQSSSKRFLVGHWWQPVDDDGEPSRPGEWAWVQAVTLTSDGWHVWSSGFKGWHGTATIPVHGNATHWMPLSDATEGGAA